MLGTFLASVIILLLLSVIGYMIYLYIDETRIYTYVISYGLFSNIGFSLARTMVEYKGLKYRQMNPFELQKLEETFRLEEGAEKCVIISVTKLKTVPISSKEERICNNKSRLRERKGGPKLMR